LTKLSPLTGFGARMNASNFGVMGQGHDGIKYAPKCPFRHCQCDILNVSFLSHVGGGIIVDGVIMTI